MQSIRRGLRTVIAVALVAIAAPAAAQNLQGAPVWPGVTLPTFVIPASAVNGGGVFNGQLLAPVTPADCSLPQYSFQGDIDTGVGYRAANQFSLCVAATEFMRVDAGNTAVTLGVGVPLALVPSGGSLGAPTVFQYPEATDHWFQRRTTTAQRASWANTYASTISYEAFSIDAQTVANNWLVGTRTVATGTTRPVQFVAQAGAGANDYSQVVLSLTAVPFFRVDRMTAALGSVGGTSATGNWFQFGGSLFSSTTSGTVNFLNVLPIYNQASGTASNCDLCVMRTETAVGSGAQYSQTWGDDTNIRAYLTSGGATGRGTQMGFTQAVAPTCSTNCGTSPSVVGADTAMRVTMGSSGVPASGWVVTFNGTWAAAPICGVTMAKTGMVTGKDALTVVTTTTTITVVTNGTAPATTDVYSIQCFGVP